MDRLQTPSGLPLYTAKEFSALAIAKNVPGELAVIQSYIADVEASDSKAAAKDQNRFKFRISTDSVDRDKDVISVDGWDVAQYLKNPVVMYAHDYHALPIGKSLSLSSTKKSLDAEVEFVPADVYPFAETVRRMVQGGILRAASVGFKPIKYAYNEERKGVDIQESHLLEWSIVPIPANADCLVQLSAMPKGVVDDFAQSCEELLEACKGKGQWVVGVDIANLATKDDVQKNALVALNGTAIAKEVLDGLQPKYLEGCPLKSKCPNSPDGHPDTCPKGKKCPLIAENQSGGMREVDLDSIKLEERTDKADVLDLDDEASHIIGLDDEGIDSLIRNEARTILIPIVKDAVVKQLNYARGRVD